MWDVELAKLFKERDSKSRIGTIIGEVAGVNPLKIKILDGQSTLEEGIHQLYITEGLFKKDYKFIMTAGDDIGDIAITSKPSNSLILLNINEKDKTKLTLFFELQLGDKVLLIPSENEQVFFIIDRIHKVGG